jgi:hypothetical protein
VLPFGELVSSLLPPINAPHQPELRSPWQRAAAIRVMTFDDKFLYTKQEPSYTARINRDVGSSKVARRVLDSCG